MKSIYLILVTIILVLIPTKATAEDNDGAHIEFAEKSFDFGTIREADGSVSHTFEFTNTGSEPLIIIDASASCGCTRPEFPKEPIKPGGKGKIKVIYNPAGRPGEFNRKVKIRTNAKGGKRVTLKITGTVIPR